MKPPTDQDGKSKTASAVDAAHYPEQHQVTDNRSFDDERTTEQVAKRAHELWLKRGAPADSAEQDWFEAEEEFRAKRNSKSVGQKESGSVQA